jgi:hypothetical protein
VTHDELALDLAAHLRGGSKRITWCNMQLGESGSPRPDVYTMEPTYTRLSFEAFEVKVSVSDFRADVTKGKWQSYLRYANSVTFAVPAGLIDKKDVPATCGLIVRHEGGWRYAKRPTVHVLTELPWRAWIKLLLDGTERSEQARRLQMFNDYVAQKKLAKRWGEDAAKLVADIHALPATAEYRKTRIESELARMREGLDEQRRDWEKARAAARERCSGALRELATVLGLEPDSEVQDLERRANRIAKFLSNDGSRWNASPIIQMASRMEDLAKEMRELVTAQPKVVAPEPSLKDL